MPPEGAVIVPATTKSFINLRSDSISHINAIEGRTMMIRKGVDHRDTSTPTEQTDNQLADNALADGIDANELFFHRSL